MEQISQNNKDRLLQFIKENDLDYSVDESIISKFHATAYDGIKFFFYKYNEDFIIVKYDLGKDNSNPGSSPYEYFNYKNFSQVLEQLSYYDNLIYKCYWNTVSDTMEIGVDINTYNEGWYNEFIGNEYWGIEDYNTYKTLIYSNPNYKPELKSPYNTLHEVSTINNIEYTKIDKLYFEIHPICCLESKETYLLKLKCNNDEILKEYINYTITSKKGLRLLIDNLFKTLEPYKI
jgi:hypothetical protein